MSKTNKEHLEKLENKALRKVLGVPLSTRITDLHLESNVDPISVRWEAMTAYQSEKYRWHPISDPLYTVSHEKVYNRLKCKSWQISTDITFESIQIRLSKKQNSILTHHNDIDIDLGNRTPLNFTSRLPPWTIINKNINIISKLLTPRPNNTLNKKV